MEITKDRLHLLTGFIALGFGIYCAIIAAGMAVFDLWDMNWFLLISCIIFSIIYIIFGISLFLTKQDKMVSFIGIGFIVVLWLPSNFEWFVWPLIIMPFVILILALVIMSRQFKRM